MQNVLNKSNKRLGHPKDLNAQLYTLCGLTAAEVEYIEKNHHRHGRLALTAKGAGRVKSHSSS